MPRIAPTLLLFGMIVPSLGCAITAKQPPTPAEHLQVRELAKIPIPDGERYYLLLFASQSTPKQPKFTHTWATVVRVVHPESGQPPDVLDVHTISWLPADGTIKTLQLKVEPGVNLSLRETLDYVTQNKERIALWGPYEVWHGFYHRFLVQKLFVESGQIGYQCIDTIGEASHGLGSNCTHAISDMDPQYDRGPYPLAFFGFDAGRNINRELMHSPVIIQPQQTHDWLIPALGIEEYSIRQQSYLGRRKEFSLEALEAGSNRPLRLFKEFLADKKP